MNIYHHVIVNNKLVRSRDEKQTKELDMIEFE